MKLLVIGDCSIDLNMHIALSDSVKEKDAKNEPPMICFYHGSKIPVDSFETNVAGNSVNVSVGTKLLGIDSAIYTETGDDDNANRIKHELTNIGVDTTFFTQNHNNPADVHAVVISGGERTIFSYHGPRKYVVRDWIKSEFIYYTSMGTGYQDFQKDLVKYLKNTKNTALAFNPGTLHIRAGLNTFTDILAFTDILFVNLEETESLIGKFPNIIDAHKKLQKFGPKITVITDGEKGASSFDGHNLCTQNSYSDSRPVIDKTGAGDAFNSGFLAAIMYGKTIQDALKWGVVNSGCGIKVTGSIRGLLNKSEIEKLVKEI